MGTVPGEPIRLLFDPLKNSRAPASLYLLRRTSTNRISACTWLGSCVSCDGRKLSWAISALARPRTNTIALCGDGVQAVHTIRLVLPWPTAVITTPRSPLAWTSATFGSPTATRSIATGKRSSCCRPWSISMIAGSWPNASQPLGAACAWGNSAASSPVQHACLKKELRITASLPVQGFLAFASAVAPRMMCMAGAAWLGAGLATLATGAWASWLKR